MVGAEHLFFDRGFFASLIQHPFWIIVLNSWMQTPVGFEMINGKAHATDWLAIIFNPSFPYRMTHMMLASGLTSAFLIAGVSAYRWFRGDRAASVMAAMKTGVYIAAFLIPLQIIAGDFHGLNTLKHQPAKVAAMEGVWETERGAPALAFAIPNEKTRSNDYAIGIPKLASLILTHELDGEIKGLNEFIGKHPPVAPVFWAFRIMVGVGMLMLAVSWLAAWQLKRKGEPARWLTAVLIGMTFAGWIATVAGWYVTEIGRQPYLVYGVMTTVEAASSVPSAMILSTFIMYLSMYLALTIAYISVVFYLARSAQYPSVSPTSEPVIGLGVYQPAHK